MLVMLCNSSNRTAKICWLCLAALNLRIFWFRNDPKHTFPNVYHLISLGHLVWDCKVLVMFHELISDGYSIQNHMPCWMTCTITCRMMRLSDCFCVGFCKCPQLYEWMNAVDRTPHQVIRHRWSARHDCHIALQHIAEQLHTSSQLPSPCGLFPLSLYQLPPQIIKSRMLIMYVNVNGCVCVCVWPTVYVHR